MSVTYSNYLKVPELLSLQKPLSSEPEHDETLFIIIHQVYELWFKQVLHELRLVQVSFEKDNSDQASRTLKRVLTILKTMVGQVDIIETMTPLSFASFRDRLESASGFQSFQFRECEALLGHRDRSRLQMVAEDKRVHLEKIYAQPSLYDSFLRFLSRKGYKIPKTVLERDLGAPLGENDEVQNIFIEIYRNHTAYSDLCERFVDLDEGLQEWRYRHIKMVERTIGMKMGTGGSAGAEYLKTTIFRPLFADLWKIRSRF